MLVHGAARIYGGALVGGEVLVHERARVFGDACVDGKIKIGGATEVRGSYDYAEC